MTEISVRNHPVDIGSVTGDSTLSVHILLLVVTTERVHGQTRPVGLASGLAHNSQILPSNSVAMAAPHYDTGSRLLLCHMASSPSSLLLPLPHATVEESEDMCTHLHRNRPCLDSLLGNAGAASVPQLHDADTSLNAATAYKRLLYPPVLAPVPVQQGPQAGRRCWRCLECSVVLSWLH
jgi:hypothetical protein